MDSPDISELNIDQSGSHLLSQPSLLPSVSSNSSRTGPGGDDLSLSELSLSDRPLPGPFRRPKFSLLAQPQVQHDLQKDDSAIPEDDAEAAAELDCTVTQEDVEKARKLAARTREEKLHHDLFILKKLNSAFEIYKEALKEAKSSTERVAEQLKHTDALLDKYVNILSKTENVARLIADERWQGAEQDEEVLERELQERMERQRQEERERLEREERERKEAEERERKAAEEREGLERQRTEVTKATRGSGVRGVRGTRASMRGIRGVPRAAPTTVPSTRGVRGASATASKRPTSSTSVRSTTTDGRVIPASRRS